MKYIIPFLILLAQTYCAQAQHKKNALLEKTDKIVFALRKTGQDGHWYANFGYYAHNAEEKAYTEDSKLCIYDIPSEEVKVLFEDTKGTYRDPQVHYDGNTILFSYRKGGEDDFHLYETDVNGSYLQQITDGPYSDIEPTYLPDGDIMFVSTRCNRWVNCWATQVAVLYRCKRDGSGITQISANIEHDNTPSVISNGQIIYTRWEYIDRSQVDFHHLWIMNPNGTKQRVLFGNQTSSVPSACLLIDAKQIPGTTDIILSYSPGHGRREHEGYLAKLQTTKGPDDKNAITILDEKTSIFDPYPIKDNLYLVSNGTALLLMDDDANKEAIFQLSKNWKKNNWKIFEPRPIYIRERENVIASSLAPYTGEGTFMLQNVYEGRNMHGVEKGSVKELLILESLPKPINFTGGNEPLTYTGSFTLEGILGTVPVEEDGSAYFKLPANRSFFFVALDDKERTVQRMKSFTSTMKGETTTCIGCHENRTNTPNNIGTRVLSLRRPASIPEPVAGIPKLIDFPRDIQPVLDKHCVKCHKPEKRKGGVLLSGNRGPVYSHAYFNLMAQLQVNDGYNQHMPMNKPGEVGDVNSALIEKIENKHGNTNLSPNEIRLIRYWINTGATYPGTYAALGTGMVGRMNRNVVDRTPVTNIAWDKARRIIKKNCKSCHHELMQDICSEENLTWWKSRNELANGKIELKDYKEKVRYSRHILYDLTEPENSTLLLAPLSKNKGGYGLCKNKNGESIFTDRNDQDYRILLDAVQNSKTYLDSIKRFDMENFVVRPEYFRELKRYGIYADDKNIKTVNAYEADRKYWKSFGIDNL